MTAEIKPGVLRLTEPELKCAAFNLCYMRDIDPLDETGREIPGSGAWHLCQEWNIAAEEIRRFEMVQAAIAIGRA